LPVQNRPENDAVDHCRYVQDSCGQILEDRRANKLIGGKVFDIHREGDHAGSADDERNKRSPTVPGVCVGVRSQCMSHMQFLHRSLRTLHSSPGDGNEEASSRGEKQYHAEPVYFSQLGEEGAMLLIEFEENCDQGSTNTEKWQVNPEDPAPRDVL